MAVWCSIRIPNAFEHKLRSLLFLQKSEQHQISIALGAIVVSQRRLQVMARHQR